MDSGRPFPRDIPPQWFLRSILVMVLLHFLVPVATKMPMPVRMGGLVLNLLGLGFGLWAFTAFRNARVPVRPFTPVHTLVATGPYRWSRNPMYVGMVAMLLGGGVAMGTWTPLLVVIPFAVLIDRRFIRREEAFLTESLGEAYREYCGRVRRWL